LWDRVKRRSFVGIGPVELLVITALCVAVPFVFTVPVGKWSVAVIRKAVGDAIHRSDPGRRTAPEILDERYARGEIGRDEYQRVRRDIERP
jgi:uncharacterized membrane protein